MLSSETDTGTGPKTGGICALLIAASYILGFALFLGVIDRTGYVGPAGELDFLADHQTLLVGAMILLYVVAGSALTGLVIAVNNQMRGYFPYLVQVTTAFGLIWAGIVIASGMIGIIGIEAVIKIAADQPQKAAAAWLAISVVQDALGGGSEFVGGVWMGFISWIGLRSKQFPKPLAWIGIVLGAAGIASLLPALSGLVDVFGLGQIVWLIWLGVLLLRPVRTVISVDS